MVTVKVDGIEIQVEPNTTILDAAAAAGVKIPVLCHHKALNPFGACRVCLVEVVGNPKMMAACTTPVMDNMEIITKSEKIDRLRKTVIELLLINHPLECPVCDKGGECLLQDLTYEVGLQNVRFDAKPNDTPTDHTNPFIERDIDRCVLCGKCVRICDEIVNIQAISFLNRGMDTIIGTAFEQPWNCEYCGQCASVCPVGSLNNRVYLFKNRPWNLENTPSICGLCSCGCTVIIDHEDNEVFRFSEDYDLGINNGYLCAKGRFGYEFINSSKRPEKAVYKTDDTVFEIGFEEALEKGGEILRKVVDKHGADSVGVLVSPRLTNEEAYQAQKFAREIIGTPNVYSFETDDGLPEGTYKDIENSDLAIVLNVDVTEANPILGLSVRSSVRKNEIPLFTFYPSETAIKRVTKEFITGNPEELMDKISNFVAAVEGKKNDFTNMAEQLKKAEKPVLIFNPYSEQDLYFVEKLKKAVPNLKTIASRAKNNSLGIVDMGCLNGMGPGYKEVEKGDGFIEAFETDKIKALIVFGENFVIRPEYMHLKMDLDRLELFMVADPFLSETAKLANLYIPVSTYAEKDGSFTNLEGRVQAVNKAVDKGYITDLDVIAALSKAFGNELATDVNEIRDEIKKEIPLYADVNFDGDLIKYPYAFKGGYKKPKDFIYGNGKYYLYPASLRLHSGSYTHWSPDLSKVYKEPEIEINPKDAEELNVKDGDYVALKIDNIMRKFLVNVKQGITQGNVSLPKDYVETADIFQKGTYLKVDLVKR
jgi:formate dehydrogenase major subunit/NADH-quinone oxidoreductase subunit G